MHNAEKNSKLTIWQKRIRYHGKLKLQNYETDPTAPTTCITYPNFSQLKVGNYWVYEQFDIDAIVNATSKNTFDSCYVEKDTIINSKTYLKMVKSNPYSTNQSDISFQSALQFAGATRKYMHLRSERYAACYFDITKSKHP